MSPGLALNWPVGVINNEPSTVHVGRRKKVVVLMLSKYNACELNDFFAVAATAVVAVVVVAVVAVVVGAVVDSVAVAVVVVVAGGTGLEARLFFLLFLFVALLLVTGSQWTWRDRKVLEVLNIERAIFWGPPEKKTQQQQQQQHKITKVRSHRMGMPETCTQDHQKKKNSGKTERKRKGVRCKERGVTLVMSTL